MNRILVLDNYDSFTYNLVHYLKELSDARVEVFRNDEITLDEVEHYDAILLSPGPGVPDEAGILKALIARYGSTKKILGVCLGCQAIGEVYGGTIYNLDSVYHGVATEMTQTVSDELLFDGVSKQFMAGRYHSWAVNTGDLPECLEVTATDDKGVVMALRHTSHNVRGVQFHPESILTLV